MRHSLAAVLGSRMASSKTCVCGGVSSAYWLLCQVVAGPVPSR